MERPLRTDAERRGVKAHRVLGKLAFPAVAFLCALLLSLANLSEALQWGALALIVLLLVVPHGAADLPVLAREVRGRRRLGVLTAYVAVFGVALALWWLHPVASLLFFLALTIFHFGQGDAWVHGRVPEPDEGRHRARARLRRGTILFAMGSLPVALPALLHAQETHRALEAIVMQLGASGFFSVEAVFGAGFALTALSIVALIIHLVTRTEGRTSLVFELALLVGLFFLSPPALAIALYLALWHAPRHMERVATHLEPESRDAWGRRWRAMANVLRDAAPATLGSLVLFAVGVWLWQTGLRPSSWLGPIIAVLAALTVPHVVVVTWLDHEDQSAERWA